MSAHDAAQITRASRSNLALAFVALPRSRRRDITTFYAFCRVVDDIADDAGLAIEDRRAALDLWRQSVVDQTPGEPALAAPIREVIARYAIPVAHFHEIIAGVEMDLGGARYETFRELRIYCHRVASVVGLVSIEIFGYGDPACRQYALDLGIALQLTNILRDVGQDYANGGRIYLPRVEMDHYGYGVGSLAVGDRDRAFRALMTFQAERAREFYTAAAAALPVADRRSMVAAEIMRTIYQKLLRRMERDGFRVFTKRYRLTRLEKAWCVASVMLKTRL